MINTCLIQQYSAPYVYCQKNQSQHEILSNQVLQDPFWKLNFPVLEGSPAKDQFATSENDESKEQEIESSESIEQAQEDQSNKEKQEENKTSVSDQSQEEEDLSKKEDDDYQIAKPFTHSGAVILTQQEMNLKFEHLPEDAALWIEENGEKRKIELKQNELSIVLNTDLVKAYIVDDTGNVIRKWSILCLEQEDGSMNDLILDHKEQEDSQLNSSQEDSGKDSSTKPQETSQTESSTSNESSESIKEEQLDQQDEVKTSQEDPQQVQTPQQELMDKPTVSPQIPEKPTQEVYVPSQVEPYDKSDLQTDKISSVSKGESKIQLLTNQKTFTPGQKVFTQNLADVQLVVDQGTILNVEVISHETKQVYSSLQEAAKAEQAGTFDIKATVLDPNLQEQQANWTVIQVGGAIATSTTTQGKQVDIVYQMDEQGQLSAKSQSHNQKIQLYRKFEPLNTNTIQSGEQLRLYLDKDPGTYQVQINGTQTDVDMEKDELGQPYLPIEAKKGTNTIKLFKDGQEVFSQEIFANATMHFKPFLITGTAILITFAIALMVYRHRGEVCA